MKTSSHVQNSATPEEIQTRFQKGYQLTNDFTNYLFQIINPVDPRIVQSWVTNSDNLVKLNHSLRVKNFSDLAKKFNPKEIKDHFKKEIVRLEDYRGFLVDYMELIRCHGSGAYHYGTDIGRSVATIIRAISEGDCYFLGQYRNSNDIPYDFSDFGRCYRYVTYQRKKYELGKVRSKFSKWEPFIKNWDTLAELFEKVVYDNEPIADFSNKLNECKELSFNLQGFYHAKRI